MRNPKAKLCVRKPRFKSKRGEQAARFTANSRFRILANGRLSLPKVGDLAVRWSRPLPAPPSSVTVTLDCSGRYHASFVVEVARNPLPAAEREVGVDLGLHVLAALSDGTTVPNPRWLRQAERALRRAQRTLSRIDRWCPSSQQCSACGAKMGPKGQAGFKVHTWTCSVCAAAHDRDVNAARNILAAGRAATACGGYVRPGLALAVAATPSGTEAGTRPGTAA
jgi:transposase